jgi:membrane peptidoglycan carboxypeptidase
MLAGLVRNPAAYDPLNHPKAGTTRRNTVLTRMRDLGYIDEAAYEKAHRTPLGLRPTASKNACQDSSAPFFCDYVEKRFLADSALGRTQQDRFKLLLRGGLDIRTTLDPKVQSAAQKAIDKKVPRSSAFGSAMAMVEPGTGNVLAIAENRDFGSSKQRGKHGVRQTNVNYATDQAYGGSTGFQSGSTFKVFTLATALEEGVPLGLRINSPSHINVHGFQNCDSGALYPPYPVSNAGDSEAGVFNLMSGTWDSVNTFYVQLERRVSQCKVAKLAERLGMRRADGGHLQANPAMTLGTNEVSPLDMAEGYATFAAQGKYCPPTVITSVVDANRKSLPVTKPRCMQAVEQGIANTVTSVLEGVINGPDPRRTGAGLGIGRPAAGKTGTVQDYADAWFIGYTPQIASAVFVGDPTGGHPPHGHPLKNVTIGGQHYSRIFGATLPGPIWQQAMQDALKGTPVKSFPPSSAKVAAGKPIVVPDVRGKTVADAEKTLSDAGFAPEVSPQTVPAGGTPGTVASTNPPGGSKQLLGTSVVIYVTNGQPPPATPLPTTTAPPPGPPGGPPTKTPKPKPSHGPHH